MANPYARFTEPEYDANYPYWETPHSSYTRQYRTQGQVEEIRGTIIKVWGVWYTVSSRSDYPFKLSDLKVGDTLKIRAVKATGNDTKWIQEMEVIDASQTETANV